LNQRCGNNQALIEPAGESVNIKGVEFVEDGVWMGGGYLQGGQPNRPVCPELLPLGD